MYLYDAGGSIHVSRTHPDSRTFVQAANGRLIIVPKEQSKEPNMAIIDSSDGCGIQIPMPIRSNSSPKNPLKTLEDMISKQTGIDVDLDPHHRYVDNVMKAAAEKLKQMTFKVDSFSFVWDVDAYRIDAVFTRAGSFFQDMEPIYEYYIRKLALNKFYTCMGDKTLPVKVNASFKK